ncbi:BnaC08g15620D [Brassica napus]|uniref:BnaC08g15620D protein n=1 Tax=Brassica napus TaxID=3708 RepID=A0A078H186_BRANA|nr:BnaC08g15620D [Brassica napus]
MFELWFREMEATTDPSSPAFLREVEAPSAPPTLFQVPGKGVFHRFTFAGLVTECGCFHRSALPMRNPKLLGQGYYCSFSAKLEVVTV